VSRADTCGLRDGPTEGNNEAPTKSSTVCKCSWKGETCAIVVSFHFICGHSITWQPRIVTSCRLAYRLTLSWLTGSPSHPTSARCPTYLHGRDPIGAALASCDTHARYQFNTFRRCLHDAPVSNTKTVDKCVTSCEKNFQFYRTRIWHVLIKERHTKLVFAQRTIISVV